MSTSILEPGQTIRLEPPWDATPGQSDYVHFVRTNPQVSLGLTTQIISGTLGSADLVLDVTLAIGTPAPLATRYRMAVTFDVGGLGVPSRYKTIGVAYKDMTQNNAPRFDIVKWNETILSAVLEPEGLTFYEIEGPIAGRKFRSRLETAEWPYLWVDLSNTIWCIARKRDIPTDPWQWVLYRSRDGARTFETVSVLPIPELALYPMGVSQGRDVWIGYSTGSLMELMRSRDGGETWEEPFNSGAFVNNVNGRFIRNPLSADARFSVFGRGTSGDSGYGFSLDEGRTWEYRTGVYMRLASVAHGWTITNFAHHDWVIGAGNMIGTLFRLNASTGFRWAFGRTFDDSLSGKVFQIAILDYAATGFFKLAIKADNTIIATNGRNYLYFSKDGGRSWFPS